MANNKYIKITIRCCGPKGSGKELAQKVIRQLLAANDFSFENGDTYTIAKRKALTAEQFKRARYKTFTYCRF